MGEKGIGFSVGVLTLPQKGAPGGGLSPAGGGGGPPWGGGGGVENERKNLIYPAFDDRFGTD